MALQLIVDSVDGLPDAVKSLYVEKNGKYELQVEGAVPKVKLDEFRSNNINLMNELKVLKETYKSVDVDQYNELLKEHQKLKDKKLIEEGKVEELVGERVSRMKTELDNKIKQLTEERDGLGNQLSTLVIDTELQKAAIASGAKATAIVDIINRGKQIFKLIDGKAIAHEGEKIKYGSDGVTPLSVTEFMKDLVSSAPHLFEESKGGGAHGNDKGQSGGKTMSRANFDKLPTSLEKSKFLKEGGKVID
jgi:hypothetical protein